MKSFLRKFFAVLIIAILALTISIVSYYFLIGQELKKEKLIVEVKATVFKEDGFGGWTPITNSGEVIDGYLNFECNITNYDYIKSKSLSIDFVEFYLTNSVPDIQNPNLEELKHFMMIKTFIDDKERYFYILDSRSLPDDTWYFITRVVDNETTSTYNTYNINDVLIPFSIKHFDDSITFPYLDTNGRINHNSHIGFVPLGSFEQYIESVDLYIVYNGIPERLTSTPINYSEIALNYHVLSLEMLSSWIESKSIAPDEYNVSFIVTLQLYYYPQLPVYFHNYTLPSIILDIIGPNITISENIFGNTYSNVEQSVLAIPIDIHDDDFESVKFEYMYSTHEPSKEIWYYYNTFIGTSIIFNIINWRDDKIFLRFTAYDDLGNVKLYQNDSYWIRKDMNNHLNFVVEELYETYIYPLGQDNMIDINVTVYPYDNDITKVLLYTDYESFELTDVLIENDYIYFTDHGSADTDIKLNPVYYNVFGSDITEIPIQIVLYQGANYITSLHRTIMVTDSIFENIVISNIDVDIVNSNISMSLLTLPNCYNNSHGIPYIANNNPPLIRILDSNNIIVSEIALKPNLDDNRTELYNYVAIEILNNKFSLPYPSLSPGEKICSVDKIIIDTTIVDFNYFIVGSQIFIILLTSTPDGIYGVTIPITMEYGITNHTYNSNQFIGYFNFTSLPSDNYTITGIFYDITGKISTFTVNHEYYIDFGNYTYSKKCQSP